MLHQQNAAWLTPQHRADPPAKGEWVLFLDSDDAMAPGLLETLRRELAAHPDFDWFIGKHLEWKPDGTLTEHTGLRLLPRPL